MKYRYRLSRIKQMAEFYRLDNQIKHYEWGSPNFIPKFLGFAPDGKPWAELWMGSHPGSPSVVRIQGGKVGLGELIASDPARYLGEKTAERYGALPYLFKLLAAGKPLSIQAHPNLAQARDGFERENRAGLAQDAPNRNYRDANHKPEIVCALTPFTGMCGFRAPNEIAGLISDFLDTTKPVPSILREGFVPLLRALENRNTESALGNFLAALFGISREMRDALTDFVLSREDGPKDCELALMRSFAEQYPGDPAIISPLYLNVFRLKPGEAVFLKAGILHAYISGFAVELMANSDNVLRGGLTQKHVDVAELMKVLEFAPMKPSVLKPADGASAFTYPVLCDEFSLSVMRGSGGASTLKVDGPSIILVGEGELSIGGDSLRKGESAFIPPMVCGNENIEVQGSFTLYVASVGKPG